jgi:hypothetical protein
MRNLFALLYPGRGEFSRQLLARAVSCDVPEVLLSTQIPLAAFRSNSTPPKSRLRTRTTTHFRLTLWLRSGPVNYSMPIGAGAVQRFSPIHF